MMSIYSGVCRIYTPRHSVHLRCPCISVQPPSLLEDVLGGHDRACLEMHLEAVDLEAMDLKAVNLKAVDREACVMEAETLFIG